ncbi:MAG: hypothetical protein ACJ78V_11090 [Myxococcales bacterium]
MSMPRAALLLVAQLVLSTASAGAQDDVGSRPVGVAIAAGGGSAYDLVGFHVELSSPKGAVFFGTGLPVFLAGGSDPHYDLAAGIRFFSGMREGIFASFQTLWSLRGDQPTDDRGQPSGDPQHFKSFGATVGNRWRWNHAFFEIGAGLMLIQGSVGCEGCGTFFPLPDLSLAGGYQF